MEIDHFFDIFICKCVPAPVRLGLSVDHSILAGTALRRRRAVDANGGSDLLDRDPDACLIFKGGYYDRVKAIIEACEAAK